MQYYIESSKIIPICEGFLAEVEAEFTGEKVEELIRKRQEVWKRENMLNKWPIGLSGFYSLSNFIGTLKNYKERAKLMKDKAVLIQGLNLNGADFAFLAQLNSKDKIQELDSLLQSAQMEVDCIYTNHLAKVQEDSQQVLKVNRIELAPDQKESLQVSTPERYKEKTFWEEIKSIWKD